MPQKAHHYLKTMKAIKFIHPKRISEETVPGTLHGKLVRSVYQIENYYYRSIQIVE